MNERKSKLKIFFLIIILLFILNINNINFASTITLEQISNKINSSNYGDYWLKNSTGFVDGGEIRITSSISQNKILVDTKVFNKDKEQIVNKQAEGVLARKYIRSKDKCRI